MSEQPFVKTIRQLLEETKDLDEAKPARKTGTARPAAQAPAKPATVSAAEDDPDLALLDELEAGLDDEEEGLEGPGDSAATTAGAAAAEAEERPGRRARRRRAGGAAAAGDGGERRPLARFLKFLGNLQERRADTMARGRRPARMISPSLMREASGQTVDPGDPVAERRRKQIQEFRAAWVESLKLKPASQATSMKPIGGPEPAANAAVAAPATSTEPASGPAPAASAAPAANAAAASKPAPAKPKKDGDRKS